MSWAPFVLHRYNLLFLRLQSDPVDTSCLTAVLVWCRLQAGLWFLVLFCSTSGSDHVVRCVQVLAESYKERETLWDNYECPKFIPFNPVDKYTIAIIKDTKSGEMMRVMKGAPQVLYPMIIIFGQWLLSSSCHCDSFLI